MEQLICENVRRYGIKCRAKINKGHPYVCPIVSQMTQCSVHGYGDGVFSLPRYSGMHIDVGWV